MIVNRQIEEAATRNVCDENIPSPHEQKVSQSPQLRHRWEMAVALLDSDFHGVEPDIVVTWQGVSS